jgi:cytochrome c oxidase subunit 2
LSSGPTGNCPRSFAPLPAGEGFWPAIIVVVPLLSAGCRGVSSALDPASRESARVADLYWLMFGICAAVFVIVLGLLGVAVARRRQSQTSEGEQKRARAVGAGAAVTALVLLVLLAASEWTGRTIVAPAGHDAVEIEITGHQWWWEVRYPGSSPDRDVTTANEIHVPVGRPVRFQLFSGDVIHSFWAPNLNGKKDLIPGRRTTHIFRADRPGVFFGQCAEFCGYQHAHMGFVLVAEEPARFSAWLVRQRSLALEPGDAASLHGREVFLSSPCVLCHTIRGAGAFGHKAPDLTHLASRSMIAAAMLSNTTGHLAGWVLDAPRLKPGTRMPPNVLAANDLLDLVAYLRSLK